MKFAKALLKVTLKDMGFCTWLPFLPWTWVQHAVEHGLSPNSVAQKLLRVM